MARSVCGAAARPHGSIAKWLARARAVWPGWLLCECGRPKNVQRISKTNKNSLHTPNRAPSTDGGGSDPTTTTTTHCTNTLQFLRVFHADARVHDIELIMKFC